MFIKPLKAKVTNVLTPTWHIMLRRTLTPLLRNLLLHILLILIVYLKGQI